MKKAFLVLLILLVAVFGGCSEPETKYKWADFEDYNSLASENGRGGDLIYIKANVDSVEHLDGNSCFSSVWFLSQSEGEWLGEMNSANDLPVNIEKIKSVFSESVVTVYGEYLGLSKKYKKPGIGIHKIECNGITYQPSDFISDEESSSEDSIKVFNGEQLNEEYIANVKKAFGNNAEIKIIDTDDEKNMLISGCVYADAQAFFENCVIYGTSPLFDSANLGSVTINFGENTLMFMNNKKENSLYPYSVLLKLSENDKNYDNLKEQYYNNKLLSGFGVLV